jgi:death-on-curing protein
LNPEFLDIDDVLEIHASQIAEHGGSEGLRDRGLLESAIAQPMAQFDGQFLNQDLFEMAAALLLSLVRNHPFVDGNKRTALLAALTFLDLNGHSIDRPYRILIAMTIEVSAGSIGKELAAKVLRDVASEENPEPTLG